jgi:hypothetical protein
MIGSSARPAAAQLNITAVLRGAEVDVSRNSEWHKVSLASMPHCSKSDASGQSGLGVDVKQEAAGAAAHGFRRSR